MGNGSFVVFGGGSAGAEGSMRLLDHVADILTPKGAKVVGFLDSSLFPNLKPFNKGHVPTFYE